MATKMRKKAHREAEAQKQIDRITNERKAAIALGTDNPVKYDVTIYVPVSCILVHVHTFEAATAQEAMHQAEVYVEKLASKELAEKSSTLMYDSTKYFERVVDTSREIKYRASVHRGWTDGEEWIHSDMGVERYLDVLRKADAQRSERIKKRNQEFKSK